MFHLNNLAQKSAIYGEGLYQKCQPEAQKSPITEKEMAIFELRKVLFPEKHLRELPGAYHHILPHSPQTPMQLAKPTPLFKCEC
jgi:hypothetical protein